MTRKRLGCFRLLAVKSVGIDRLHSVGNTGDRHGAANKCRAAANKLGLSSL